MNLFEYLDLSDSICQRWGWKDTVDFLENGGDKVKLYLTLDKIITASGDSLPPLPKELR